MQSVFLHIRQIPMSEGDSLHAADQTFDPVGHASLD